MESDPRVGVTVIDPDDQYNVVAFRGTAIDITTGSASYPMCREGEVRIRVTVRTDHITMQG